MSSYVHLEKLLDVLLKFKLPIKEQLGKLPTLFMSTVTHVKSNILYVLREKARCSGSWHAGIL